MIEKDFMSLLVAFYPEQSAEVRKYIRLAGYKEEEIMGLIDRTVGRGSKTEFLYKEGVREETGKRK